MTALDLTATEQTHVRAALQFLRLRSGGWTSLARALHFSEKTLSNVGAGQTVSPTMAVRIAKLAKVGVDHVLQGQFPAPGTCPHCGHPPEPEGAMGPP